MRECQAKERIHPNRRRVQTITATRFVTVQKMCHSEKIAGDKEM